MSPHPCTMAKRKNRSIGLTADTAYDYHMVLRINSVNDAMVAELVLPIASQQAAQWQPVFLPARSLRGRSSRFSVFSLSTSIRSTPVADAVRSILPVYGYASFAARWDGGR